MDIPSDIYFYFFFFLYHASHTVVLNCAPAECVIYLWDADSHKGTHTHTRRSGFLWLPVKKINHSTTLQCSNTTAYYSKKLGTIFMLASKGEWQAALGPENLTNKPTARSNYLLCVRWHLKTFVNSKYKGENYDAVVEFICFILPVCLLSLCSTCDQKWLGSELFT